SPAPAARSPPRPSCGRRRRLSSSPRPTRELRVSSVSLRRMTAEPVFWKRCSTCKKALPFEAVYWECNVSTCNRPRTALAFCSVPCWDAHVPTLRHRDAWAEERRSPRREEWERQQREEAM